MPVRAAFGQTSAAPEFDKLRRASGPAPRGRRHSGRRGRVHGCPAHSARPSRCAIEPRRGVRQARKIRRGDRALPRGDPSTTTIRRFGSTSGSPSTRPRRFPSDRDVPGGARGSPDNAPAVLLLADALLQNGQFQQVIDLLAPRESQFGSDLAFGYVLGTALLPHRSARARAGVPRPDLQRWRIGGGASSDGDALMETRDFPGAVTELQKALAINPDLPTLRTMYARALLGAGDQESAVRELQRALRPPRTTSRRTSPWARSSAATPP